MKMCNQEIRTNMNHEQVGKHAMQCFRRMTYHTRFFNMVLADVC